MLLLHAAVVRLLCGSESLNQLAVSCQLPGCNSIAPPAPSVAGSHWDDDDPDGTGVSRVRAMAELE